MHAGYSESQKLYKRAVEVIPGGIYGSKSPGFTIPGAFPYYFTEGEGCRVKDADGNEYIDYLCGFGSMILGFGNPVVDTPAMKQLAKGDLLNCPAPVMVELAERLTGQIEGMDWAVFAKNGSDATTLAVSLARVHTGRRAVFMAGHAYHGTGNWCSSNDYPILDDKNDVETFPYGDLDALAALFERRSGDVAAVILTPYHHPAFGDSVMPPEGWYTGVEKLCRKNGALFIMDDIRANFRLSMRGSHEYFGAHPDFVAMGKCLANGYPIAVIMGTKETKKTASGFFISGTFWTSSVPMIAAMACLDEMIAQDVLSHVMEMGKLLKRGLSEAAGESGYRIRMTGPDSIPYLSFENDPDLYHNQAFSAAMAERGVYLHPHHNWFLSWAHKPIDIEETVDKARDAFKQVKETIERR